MYPEQVRPQGKTNRTNPFIGLILSQNLGDVAITRIDLLLHRYAYMQHSAAHFECY